MVLFKTYVLYCSVLWLNFNCSSPNQCCFSDDCWLYNNTPVLSVPEATDHDRSTANLKKSHETIPYFWCAMFPEFFLQIFLQRFSLGKLSISRQGDVKMQRKLPRNENGKTDVRALQARHAMPCNNRDSGRVRSGTVEFLRLMFHIVSL